MKLIAKRPLYLGGMVVQQDASFETTDLHARQLLERGYVVEGGSGDPVVRLEETVAEEAVKEDAPANTPNQAAPAPEQTVESEATKTAPKTATRKKAE